MRNIADVLRMRRLTIILLLALIVDVTYGVVTNGTIYGCGQANPITSPDQTGTGLNWQVLVEPCFYIYFYGVVGGSALVIFSLPAPKKQVESTTTTA